MTSSSVSVHTAMMKSEILSLKRELNLAKIENARLHNEVEDMKTTLKAVMEAISHPSELRGQPTYEPQTPKVPPPGYIAGQLITLRMLYDQVRKHPLLSTPHHPEPTDRAGMSSTGTRTQEEAPTAGPAPKRIRF